MVMFVSLNSNTTGVPIGARTALPFGTHEFVGVFMEGFVFLMLLNP
jgi:hypothetical protein